MLTYILIGVIVLLLWLLIGVLHIVTSAFDAFGSTSDTILDKIIIFPVACIAKIMELFDK